MFDLVKINNLETHPSKKQGILVFEHTSEVIQVERLLAAEGFEVEIKGPPPQLQSGCDMVILFNLMLEPSIMRSLEQINAKPLQVLALTDELLEPVSLYQVKDYGEWIMVRAANMKITVEKESGIIVNISGGGCPDVPFLASILLHQDIFSAQEPRITGKTLCSYSLQKAFLEAKRILADKGNIL